MQPGLTKGQGVLFLCLGNSCRSILAEAVARAVLPSSVRIASAGLEPLGYVAEESLLVLAEAGFPTAHLRSKGLKEVNPEDFHLLVNLTSQPVELLLPWKFSGRILHYPLPDPFGRPLSVYRRVLDLIRGFVREELPKYLADQPQEPGPEREPLSLRGGEQE